MSKSDWEKKYDEAMAFEANGIISEAIVSIKESIKLNPDNAHLINQLGFFYLKSREFKSAKECCEKSIKLDPDISGFHNNFANAYIFCGEYDDAKSILKNAISNFPDDEQLYDTLGTCCLLTGNYDIAIQYYKNAINMNPQIAEFYCNAASAYIKADKYADAAKAMEKAVELGMDMQKELISVYYNLGEHNKIKNILENIASKDKDTFLMLASLEALNENYEQAIEHARDAIKNGSTDSEAYYILGIADNHLEEYSDAIVQLNKAIKLDPSRIYYYSSLIEAYSEKKDLSSAYSCLEKALLMNPEAWQREKLLEQYLVVLCEKISDDSELLTKYNQVRKEVLQIPEIKLCEDKCKYISDELFLAILRLYIVVYNFMFSQILNKPPIEDLIHYKTTGGLKLILKEDTAFRLYNAEYMNDPEEGTLLLERLKQNSNQNDILNEIIDAIKYTDPGDDLEVSNTYLACFSLSKDKLPMWSLYGDKGYGICGVINKDFFNFDIQNFEPVPKLTSYPDTNGVKGEKSKKLDFENKESKAKLSSNILYKVSYLKRNSTEQSNEIQNLIETLNSILEKIDLLTKNIEAEKKKDVIDLLIWIFDKLRFLFKDDSYAYEKEYRLIRSHDIFDNAVKTDESELPCPKAYVEADNMEKFAYDEIILGSCVNSPEMLVPWLKKTRKVKRVSVSKIHYR